jgi:endonuclease YncB( thermonuclease family)
VEGVSWDRSGIAIQKTVDAASRGLPIPFTYHAWIDAYKQGWHDGDTPYLWIQTEIDRYWGRAGKPIRSRIAGISCPELQEQGGPEARDYARSWILPGHEVMVIIAAKDNFGRPLVVMKVMPDGTDYANHMIMHGYGTVYRYAPKEARETED